MWPIKVSKGLLTESEAQIARASCSHFLGSRALASATGPLMPLTESASTQVYVAHSEGGEPIVVKRHENRNAFARELLALQMFGRISFAPTLLAEPDNSALVIPMRYYPERCSVDSYQGLAMATSGLAKMHEFAARCFERLDKKIQNRYPKFSELSASAPPEVADLFGDDYCPASLGDLKEDHIRWNGEHCIFLDLETFGWGKFEVFDLCQLAMLTSKPEIVEHRVHFISSKYCSERAALGGRWPVDHLPIERWMSGLLRNSGAFGGTALDGCWSAR